MKEIKGIFEDLFITTDPITGTELEWEWDSDNLAFVSSDSSSRRYILRPTKAVLEVDEEEVDEEDDELDDDY